MDNVLVIGGGGREHILAEKLKRDEEVGEVYCAPGNGGTEASSGITNMEYKDFADLSRQIKKKDIDFLVVGPEKPLVEGLSDYLTDKNPQVFGFSRKTAALEASKSFADEFKRTYGVSSPQFVTANSLRKGMDYLEKKLAKEGKEKLWVKADELCGGKGAIGVTNIEEGEEALTVLLEEKKCGDGEKVVIQEDVPGEELTVQALTDGSNFILTPPSQDHKQLCEGSTGPNTGGMGAYAPAPAFSETVEESFEEKILAPTVKGLRGENLGGPGVLYFGLGLSREEEPKVLEYNVRFGDPEAQAVLSLLDSDLYPILKSAAHGDLSALKGELNWKKGAAICVVISVDGYPRDYGDEDFPIEGIEQANAISGARVYHSGTTLRDGKIYTDGGRVLSVTASGDSLQEAQKKAYRAVDEINFQDMYYRSDIGDKALG